MFVTLLSKYNNMYINSQIHGDFSDMDVMVYEFIWNPFD